MVAVVEGEATGFQPGKTPPVNIDVDALQSEADEHGPLPYAPRYACEIQSVETYALRAFLAARLAQVEQSLEPGTPEHFAVRRLREVTDQDCLLLETWAMEWKDHAEGVDGLMRSPGNALIELGNTWNRLVATARGFNDHPDYLPRWRELALDASTRPRRDDR